MTGFPDDIEVKEIKVGKQERTPAEKAKVDAVKNFLDIIPPEEIDVFFLENMNLAARLGYKLAAEPRVLLTRLESEAG